MGSAGRPLTIRREVTCSEKRLRLATTRCLCKFAGLHQCAGLGFALQLKSHLGNPAVVWYDAGTLLCPALLPLLRLPPADGPAPSRPRGGALPSPHPRPALAAAHAALRPIPDTHKCVALNNLLCKDPHPQAAQPPFTGQSPASHCRSSSDSPCRSLQVSCYLHLPISPGSRGRGRPCCVSAPRHRS